MPKNSHNSTTQMIFCAMVLIIGVLIVPGHKRSATSFLDQSYDPFNNHTHTSPKKHLAKKFHYVVMNFKCTTILHNGATQMLSCVKAVSEIHYFTTNFLCPSFQISNSVQMIVCAWALCRVYWLQRNTMVILPSTHSMLGGMLFTIVIAS